MKKNMKAGYNNFATQNIEHNIKKKHYLDLVNDLKKFGNHYTMPSDWYFALSCSFLVQL